MSDEKKNEAPEAPIEVSPTTGELPDDAMSDASGGALYPVDQFGTLTSQKPS